MGKARGFLSPLQVAQYTGMEVETIYSLMEDGQLDAMEINGQKRVRRSELDRWLDEEVSPKQLLKLAGRMKEEMDSEEVADLLDMEEEEVEKLIE